MTEEKWRIHPAISEPLDEATKRCPGCYYNCYVMEENLRLDLSSLSAFFLSAVALLLELPTLYQMLKIMARRKKSGWGKNVRLNY